MPPTSSGPLRATRVDPQGHRGAGRLWTFPPSVAVLRPWRYSLSYRGLISREQATEVSQRGLRPTPFPPPMALLAEAIEVRFPPCVLMNYKLPGNQVPHICRGITSPDSGTIRTVHRPSNRLGLKQMNRLGLKQIMIRPNGKRLELGLLPP